MSFGMFNDTTKLFMLVFFVCMQLVSTGKVPALIVFGDSTVDTGNNNYIPTVVKSNFKPYGRDFEGGKPTGRFSNGKITPDFLSEGLGLKPTIPAYLDPTCGIKDFATGVTFASAGTGIDDVTATMFNVIPLRKQVQYFAEYKTKLTSYLGNQKATETITEALYIVSIGTNDFLENFFATHHRSSQFTLPQYEDFLIGLLEDFVVSIYKLGARKVSMTGISVVGCLPLERLVTARHSCKEEYNDVARKFDVKISALIGKLNARLPGLKMVLNQVYDALYSIFENPGAYGFDNVELACCGTGMVDVSYLCNQLSFGTCPDADKFVFWDAFHPTEKTNRIMASYSLNHSLAQFL